MNGSKPCCYDPKVDILEHVSVTTDGCTEFDAT
jgi:hypothetical protein